MRRYRNPNRGLWGGIVLIVVGTLFLLDRMWYLDFGDYVRTWWPSILIATGLWLLLSCRGQRASWVGPLVMIFVGAVFQADRLDWLDRLGSRNLWPLFMIAVGAALLIDRLRLARSDSDAAGPGGASSAEEPQPHHS